MGTDEISFPRLQAKTLRFTLGAPRTFAVSADGSRVLFLRSPSSTSREHGLWALQVATGEETQLVDPGALLGEGDVDDLPPEERARRERAREQASGVVSYATDRDQRVVAFALSGELFVVDPATGKVRELPTEGKVLDPRPDPTGQRVGYVCGGALRVIELADGADRVLAEPDGAELTWGLAEFIAAEEMGRTRGYWWSPDGQQLIAARVDNSPVARWYIADPANPDRPASEIAYPAAGTANAEVSAAVIGLDASRRDISWDRAAFPYLVTAHWSAGGPPLLVVQSRALRILTVDPATGHTEILCEEIDPHWVEIMPGVPAWTPDGRLVRISAREGAYRLLVDEHELTDATTQVRAVLHVGESDVLFTASTDDPTQVHVFRADYAAGLVDRVSTVEGVHSAARGGATTVLVSASLDWFGSRAVVLPGADRADEVPIRSHAQLPPLTPNLTMLVGTPRELRSALLLPTGHQPGSATLPVLLDPYGGPHAQRVLAARNVFLASQWLADQGFAVLVTDGRGSPGRGPDWDRAIAFDLAEATLTDQVDALHAAAEQHPDLDLSRVAIRGWSFGGYLSALAVLRRPDVFHAGIAGAPVTDWRLYDTHYTERYLGQPAEQAEVYERNSLIADAPALTRPLMIIHGLADDNVVAAHTLRLSSALLAAGRAHTVLPLSGVTHMTPQEQVAENLLLVQVDFLRRALSIPSPENRSE